MGWVNNAIAALAKGNLAVVRPHGGSMKPLIESGATVTLEPATVADVVVGDKVLSRVGAQVFLHLVKETRCEGGQCEVLIGNNHGKINGWSGVVYGRVIAVEDPRV